MEKNDFLTRAIELAMQNVADGGGPFGAVIVKEGAIVAEGVNRVTNNNDPTAHAEVQAIRKACEVLKTYNLSGCEIYTSCEPCPMCFSAIYWSHIDRVYFAATHHDAEDAGFDDAHIYREVKLKPTERSIQFIKVDHSQGADPFKRWIEKEDKNRY
ncbi:MAG TPA: nucleoside deaminase [Prolixibacteraceae bacterium]|nr:nucleoside deaminase [Prolixibacteraceae bacterium]HPS11808.1 nucleoside deaminase [Prolixibacteraceae bacterium]